MVAGAFAKAGYWTGYSSWEPNRFNPRGYFEDPALIRLNEQILLPFMQSPLETLAKRHPATQTAPNERLWLGLLAPDVEVTPNPAMFMAMGRYASHSPFCLKDPQFCYSLEAWRSHLRDARFICVFRHPQLTAESMVSMCANINHCKPMRFTHRNAFDVWIAMYRRILDRHASLGDWMFLHFDQMFEDGTLAELQAFSGSQVAGTFADPRLRKSPPTSPLPSDVEPLYRELCSLAGFEPGKCGSLSPPLSASPLLSPNARSTADRI